MFLFVQRILVTGLIIGCTLPFYCQHKLFQYKILLSLPCRRILENAVVSIKIHSDHQKDVQGALNTVVYRKPSGFAFANKRGTIRLLTEDHGYDFQKSLLHRCLTSRALELKEELALEYDLESRDSIRVFANLRHVNFEASSTSRLPHVIGSIESVHAIFLNKWLVLHSKAKSNIIEKQNHIAQQVSSNEDRSLQLKWSLAVLTIVSLGFGFAYTLWNQNQKVIHKLGRLNDAKDELIAVIIHDLNNPIQMYQGIAAAIEYNLKEKDWDKLELIMNDINKTGYQIEFMMESILSWGHNRIGERGVYKSTFDLNKYVASFIDVYHLICKNRNVSIQQVMERELIIEQDQEILGILIRNALDNASKFALSGSRIDFIAKRTSNGLILIFENQSAVEHAENIERIIAAFDRGSSLSSQGFGWIMIRQSLELLDGKVEFYRKTQDIDKDLALVQIIFSFR